MRLISVDPGLSGTGWVLWEADPVKPLAAGILTPDKPCLQVLGKLRPSTADDAALRAQDLGRQLAALCTQNYVSVVAIEYPAFFESEGGRRTARRGDLVKLTVTVGILAGRVAPLPVKMVMVNEWKGQLSKELVMGRIVRRLGLGTCLRLGLKSHSWDAAGIGLHVLGKPISRTGRVQ